MFHVFGLSVVLNGAVFAGSTLSLMPRFVPEAAYDQLQDHGITFLPGVPTMHGAFLSVARTRREAGAEPADFSRLRMPLSGGASLPVETLRAAEKLFGVPVLEGYGLSENAGACFFNPVDAPTRRAPWAGRWTASSSGSSRWTAPRCPRRTSRPPVS
ncbi:AMP-binding protein, partial [Micrococcus luteus]|uniref:AMP-binding protein n=1 Tax=Micrococcus luteus TaxID=1270 RepID=UPI001E569010